MTVYPPKTPFSAVRWALPALILGFGVVVLTIAQTTNRLATAVRVIDDDLVTDTGTVTASNLTAVTSITLAGDTRTAWPTGGGGMTFGGYDSAVTPAEIFGWYSGGSIASSNNAAPVYWSSTDASGDYDALGFTSSDTLLQSRYAKGRPKVYSFASGWASGTGMVVSVYTSTNNAAFTAVDLRLTAPDGTQFTTNNLVSSSPNVLTHYFIPTTSLPTFQVNNATNWWTIRFDYKCKSSMTSAVANVQFKFQ